MTSERIATPDAEDVYAASGDPDATAYTAAGPGDFDAIAKAQAERGDETLVINMGPQHPSTHGVLRLMVECDGETVLSARPGIGFLHSGIEKNMEYRSWNQGSAFVTRMDYVAPIFNEAAYCFAVERLLGIEDDIPQRAKDIRVLFMELCRIASHLIAVGTGGMEIGALTMMTIGFRERERILDFFEAVTGLRMNHAYLRPGGVSNDLPENAIAELRDLIKWLDKHFPEYAAFCNENPIFKGRMCGIGYQDLSACMALGVTGPILRSTG
jgi:NADH-quinone oxidoreductase subunit D